MDPNINIQDMFSRWKKAYEQLASILDTFSLGCTQLSSALKHPGACEWSGLEESLTYVDAAFASLNDCCSQTSKVRATLGTVHNQSRSLVPFSKLPDEVVVHILSLVNAKDSLDLRYEPSPIKHRQPPWSLLSILATNKHLRRIATSAPSLWTYAHLLVEDLGDTYLQYIQRVLLYSEQLPLQIRITGDVDDDEAVARCLTRLLDSHAHRIVSLDFRIDLTCAWPVILDLFTNIPSCQIQELYLNDSDAYPEEIDDTFPDRILDGDLDTFLRSLRVIGTRGFFIPLTTPAYSDLTVLKIMPWEFKWPESTLVELRNALSACPKLRSLALIDCGIRTSPRVSIEPVLLPDLEILDLRSLDDDDELLALISCIDSGSTELAFSVSTGESISADAMAKLRQFIRKSNVTRLCLDAAVDVDDMNWLLSLRQGETLAIRELALCCYHFKGVELHQPLRASRFPCLRTLHLMGCTGVDVRVCRQLLDDSTIQVLRFDNPRVVAEQEMFGVASSVEPCLFSTSIANGEDHCEWPVYVFR
ncbi:hypothetical protein FRC12_019136 [Ceratobasidium sp. 428]|nr:hypothetical protein FRC12_019136 [Ceratobasidium sp. 428]